MTSIIHLLHRSMAQNNIPGLIGSFISLVIAAILVIQIPYWLNRCAIKAQLRDTPLQRLLSDITPLPNPENQQSNGRSNTPIPIFDSHFTRTGIELQTFHIVDLRQEAPEEVDITDQQDTRDTVWNIGKAV